MKRERSEREDKSEEEKKKTLKDYEPDFIHMDIKYLPKMQVKAAGATCSSLSTRRRAGFIKPKYPQTNGMVERFNGQISDILKTAYFAIVYIENTLCVCVNSNQIFNKTKSNQRAGKMRFNNANKYVGKVTG